MRPLVPHRGTVYFTGNSDPIKTTKTQSRGAKDEGGRMSGPALVRDFVALADESSFIPHRNWKTVCRKAGSKRPGPLIG